MKTIELCVPGCSRRREDVVRQVFDSSGVNQEYCTRELTAHAATLESGPVEGRDVGRARNDKAGMIRSGGVVGKAFAPGPGDSMSQACFLEFNVDLVR
jgi:hypothetical protein